MPVPQHFDPAYIRDMATIMMPIAEISSRLSELVGQVSYFELIPFDDSVFTSDKYDVAMRSSSSGVLIDVAEPICGQPDLTIVLLRDNKQLRQEITSLLAATRERKKLLASVMKEIYQLNSGNRTPNASIRMSDVADKCNLHITQVSRILDNKVCQIDSKSVNCREFIYGLRSNGN